MTRPALADALAVVTTCDDAAWWRMMLTDAPTRLAPEGVEWEMGGGVPWARLRGWAHATPADALAALVEAELLPEHWSDEGRAPRWWCPRCAGVGRVTLRSVDGSGDLGSYVVTPDAHGALRCDAFDVSGAPPCSAPPSHASLVAVVSLGVDTLARAEAIVTNTWRARLVWRVMGAEAIRAEHFARNGTVTGATMVRVVAARAWAEWPSGKWPEVCPFAGGFGTPDDDRHGVHRAWPALRALAALGLHLLAVDDGRVTLGVEAL